MRVRAFLLFLLMLLPIMIYAQEDSEPEGDDPAVEPDWDFYETDLYSSGDQTFTISVGVVFPTVFLNSNGGGIDHNFTPPIGGTGSLSYSYFFTPHIYAGVEISGMFINTLSGSTLFTIPLGAKAGYQFNLWRFEFPVGITVGMVWHRYLGQGHYGFYMKGGGGIYYKFNSEWSFGLNTAWCWFPQWTKEKSKEVHGNMLDLTLSARYHF